MALCFKIENATVQRDGKPILSSVSIKAEAGEKIAILGPNGAGKSTLINVIARLTYPLRKDEYKNEIFGNELWIIKELRPLIGLVSPSFDDFLTTKYTVLEIVTSGLYSSLGFDFHHTVKDEDWKKAKLSMKRVGILHLENRRMDTLSTGEKRRVLLARATITNPPLLLLDEASNGLDFPSRADLRNTISSYAEEGRTIVMVTHETTEILPEIKRVILMKNGKIVEDGKKEDLLNSKTLSSLYERNIYVAQVNGIYTTFC